MHDVQPEGTDDSALQGASFDEPVAPQFGLEASRAVLRGGAGALLFILAASLSGVPVSSAAYVGLLLGVISPIEQWLQRHGTVGAGTFLIAWFGVLAAVVLAHFQAVYAVGVISTRSAEGGVQALLLERTRLFSPAPGELGSLAALTNLDLFASITAGASIALFCAVLARPLSDAKGAAILAMWAALAVTGLVLGTVTVTGILALRDPGFCFVPYLVALFIAVDAAPALVCAFAAWTIGDWTARSAFKVLRGQRSSVP